MNDVLPSEKEIALMRTIFVNGAMYAYHICRESKGEIKTASVYKIASRLVDKGLLTVYRPVGQRDHPGVPRPVYRLTARGQRVLRALDDIR